MVSPFHQMAFTWLAQGFSGLINTTNMCVKNGGISGCPRTSLFHSPRASAIVGKVNLVFGNSRLRATTVRINDPGPLNRFLPHDEPHTAFLRGGEGFITLGEVERFETDSPDAADVWWSEAASHIDHDSEMPGAYGTGPIAVGSFAFDVDHSEERSVLIIPRTIIGRRGGEAWMTKLGTRGNDFSLPEAGEPLIPPGQVNLEPGATSERLWMDIVSQVIQLIRSGQLDKVVLARDVFARADTPLDGRLILHRLTRRYPSCYSYLVDGMVGATPELLIRREAGLATSRVLAGTLSLKPDAEDPLAQAAELTHSSKDIAEHEFAVQSVAAAIEPYCAAMNVPEAPFVLRLPNVMHLATDITGAVDPQASSLTLAGALHPTAAVCGTPTYGAMQVIDELESLDRGRYAGPVGWVDTTGDGEWAIALRGGRIQPSDPSTIQLFAGCGIVADSDPESELAETKAKLLPMLQALGLAD